MKNSEREAKILNDLIAVNLDACHFYHDAAEKVSTPSAEVVLNDLGKIHTHIVEGLGMAAYRMGAPVLVGSGNRATDGPMVFDRLDGGAAVDVDCRLVDAVENAENRCIDILNAAIYSEDVSSDIKMHVLEAATMLDDRHAHIHRLRDLATLRGDD